MVHATADPAALTELFFSAETSGGPRDGGKKRAARYPAIGVKYVAAASSGQKRIKRRRAERDPM